MMAPDEGLEVQIREWLGTAHLLIYKQMGGSGPNFPDPLSLRIPPLHWDEVIRETNCKTEKG